MGFPIDRNYSNRRITMAMSQADSARPNNAAGQNATTKDRGNVAYFDSRTLPNKSTITDGRLVVMQNAPGQHTRRAPGNKVILSK